MCDITVFLLESNYRIIFVKRLKRPGREGGGGGGGGGPRRRGGGGGGGGGGGASAYERGGDFHRFA